MSVQRQPGLCTPNAPPTAQPILGQRSKAIQAYGAAVNYPLALSEEVRKASITGLNQILADSIYLRDMYKKGQWQVTGATFMQIHKMFGKHFKKQNMLVDKIGDRVQILGGVAVAVPHDVAAMTRIERPPIDREELPVQLSRLLEAHEAILKECHELVKLATANGDDGTMELIADHVIRPHERQVWRLSAHLTDTPEVCASK